MLVIGVGTPDRGDDAVGWWVAEQLAEVCETAVSGGDPASMIELWEHHSDVVVVDATRCERAPGTVTVVDLIDQRLPQGTVASGHGSGPLEAVELAESRGALPSSLTMVGIDGCDFEPGHPMSPEVERGAERAVEIISSWAT